MDRCPARGPRYRGTTGHRREGCSEMLFFDPQDHDLLKIVNDVIGRDKGRKSFKKLLNPHLHPRGIKELAASQDLRIAHAASSLLDTIDAGAAADRLNALRSLREEVLNGTQGAMRVNAARVLVEVMKHLLRARGDDRLQLELAHDFRSATTGRPAVIRALLRRYHLLEMPEEWNQVTFDHHVHDANTKGRKTPSHLIMDAWIKGIRKLTVIHYNHITPEAADELLEAADIMGISVRIGLEFPARFHDRFAEIIWTPSDIGSSDEFLNFLSEDAVQEVLRLGREVSRYQEARVLELLNEYNTRRRFALKDKLGFEPPAADERAFRAFVGAGQASALHLAEFLHLGLAEAAAAAGAPLPISQKDLENECLAPDGARTHGAPAGDTPFLLSLTPLQLIDRLSRLPCRSRFILNLSGLDTADALELLYECRGAITGLEIFNLKDMASGQPLHSLEINELRQILNKGNVVGLKNFIMKLIRGQEESGAPPERTERLRAILRDMDTLKTMYRRAPLKSRIGSDSTGRAENTYGMGFAITHTLPPRAQREIKNPGNSFYKKIPVNIAAYRRVTWVPRPTLGPAAALLGRLPGMQSLSHEIKVDWQRNYNPTVDRHKGNIVTLGGMRESTDGGATAHAEKRPARKSWTYLNTGLKNQLKVLIGFLPAFAAFALTKDWWLLAYCGAFIWFGITGVRNVIQSVIAGRGFHKYSLLKWKDYVSWERVADSLLYTGFSVPLLDYLVKTVLLDRGMGITTATNPVALYAIMALINGLYISTHNTLRGLPRAAIIGNFFRSILSIPLAIAFNSAFGGFLVLAGTTAVDDMLQKWAAIISKFASDCVAGMIEGAADRRINVTQRLSDYQAKIGQVFSAYARLELLFPETSALEKLESPKKLLSSVRHEARDLEQVMIINALDLMYFWMYQPRSRTALLAILRDMDPEEREIFKRSHIVLTRQKEISRLFIDGLIGKNFKHGLAFYLSMSDRYLSTIRRITQ